MNTWKPLLLLPVILFQAFSVTAEKQGFLINNIRPNTLYAGRTGEIDLPLSRMAEDISVALMPGAPYEADALTFPQKLKSIVATDKYIHILGSDDGLFTVSPSLWKISSFLSHGKKLTNLSSSADTLYFTEGKKIKIIQPGSQDSQGAMDSFIAEKEITSFSIHLNIACVLLEKRELLVMDFDIKRPKVLGRYTLEHEYRKIIASDNLCYLLSPTEGLTIFDIRTPEKIIREGGFKTTGPALDMAIIGEHAFIANGWTGVTVLNISDPSNIIWLAGSNNLGFAETVKTGKDYIVVKNSDKTLVFVDVKRPERPRKEEAIDLGKKISDYAILDDSLFVVTGKELRKVIFKDIRPPDYMNDGVNLGGSRRVFLRGGIAYVADWFSGLHLYDISIPEKPRLLSTFHTPGSPKGVLVEGELAFVGDDDHGLQIINISNPAHPFLVSNLRMPGLAYSMRLRGNYLYIAMHRGGFHIVDISDINNPKIAGSYNTEGKSWSVELAGENLFVSDDSSGVLVFNVGNPEKIEKIGAFNPGGFAEDLIIKDNLAYVVFFDKGLFIVDISNPETPRQVAHLQTPGSARGIDIQGDFAYVADWFAGFHVIDITTPEKPRFVASYDTDGAAWGIKRRGKYIFLMDWWGGFKVFDISNHEKPLPVGGYHKRGRVNDIAIEGNRAYLANGSGGLQVFDLKNPLFPVWITGVDLPGNALDIDIEGDFAYMALGDGGLATLNIRDPFEPTLIAIHPVATERVYVLNGLLCLLDSRAKLIVYKILPKGGFEQLYTSTDSVTDFTLSWDKIYLVINGKEIVQSDTPLFSDWTKIQGVKNPGLIRVFAKKAYITEKNRGIHLYKIEDGNFLPEAFIPLNDMIVDMKVTSERLLVLGENSGLMEFQVLDGKKPLLTGVYNPVKRMTRVETTNSFAFLSGEPVITSIKYLPSILETRVKEESLKVHLPSTLPPGTYNLVLTSEGERKILPDAFRVVPEPPQKKFTMEDFNKILEEMKAKQLKKQNKNNAPGF